MTIAFPFALGTLTTPRDTTASSSSVTSTQTTTLTTLIASNYRAACTSPMGLTHASRLDYILTLTHTALFTSAMTNAVYTTDTTCSAARCYAAFPTTMGFA